MDSRMKADLDQIMGTWALSGRSASHQSDRDKLRNLFIRWYEKDVQLNVADWEAYLIGLNWTQDARLEVLELPSDIVAVAKHFGR